MARESADTKAKIMRFFARGISSGFTGFIMLFAIGESIDSVRRGKAFIWDYDHIKMIIFCLLIVAGTGLGWWRDKLGGLTLIFTGVLCAILLLIELEHQDYWIIGILGLPFILSGLLFFLSWRRTERIQIL